MGNLKKIRIVAAYYMYIFSFSGQDNVVGLDLCLRENENIVFIMPYLQHKQFSVSLLHILVVITVD